MRVGLIDVDGHNFPNIPLMKLSSWHKARGDSVEWYEPLLSGKMDVVYMSKVFTFSPDYPYYVNAEKIVKGGSGYAIALEDGREVYHKEQDEPLPQEIEHAFPDYSIYGINDTAYGFLTRGCPRACDFCHVAAKEGRCSVKVADLSEFWNGQNEIILCDPNLLACKEHEDLLGQLAESKAGVEFNQGLDMRFMTERNVELLRKVRVRNMHVAFDRYEDREIIVEKMRLLNEAGFDRNRGRVSCFLLVNFNTTLEQDIERAEICRAHNLNPFVMIYDKEHAAPVYKQLARWCNRPPIFWTCKTFEEYKRRA